MWILTVALVLIAIAAVIYFTSGSDPKLDFTDKHVLITGGSSGIGENVAYLFANLGAHLTLASNQPEDVSLCLPLVETSEGGVQGSEEGADTVLGHIQAQGRRQNNQRTLR
eukprot:TRINITY_DN12109_c0_g1_i3.p2 TRINITY_DN12109_c0_g1~~TRINITY_DN12109_c0_g1_i3.p2  ORF type:complete len:111 (+),score=17.47 TRINITY_DN12109_c0_g1_i3:204-536(+)